MDDWKPGDLAECVDVRDLRLPFRHVARGGRVLRIGMVYIVQSVLRDQAGVWLLDVGAQHGPKLACRFRKVDPLDDAETAATDAEQGETA